MNHNSKSSYDELGSIVLCGMYRMLILGTVVVSSVDGGKIYVENIDYKVNPYWGQVAAIDGRLGTNDVRITAMAAMQRID
jgi:hypothetical protein